MTTVLVTGGTGFIGRRLVAHLRELPQTRVLSLGRSDPHGLRIALEELSPHFWSERGIEAIDTVFHLGGFAPKNVPAANEIRPVVSATIDGTAALLASLPPFRHIVYASSVDVYRHEAGQTLDENSAIGPATLHAASKVFAEQLVRVAAGRANAAHTIARLGHIFGPGEQAYEKLIPNLIRAMLAGTTPVLSGDGSTLRDFLYVDDAAAILAALGTRNESVDPVNVVRGESISILETARHIAALTGYRGAFGFAGENGASLRFDRSRLRALVGEQSLVSLEEGLAREVASFKC